MQWDRRAIWRAGTITILTVCMVHLGIGVLLVIFPAAGGATILLGIQGVIHLADGTNRAVVSTALILSTALAVWGVLCKHHWPRVLLFMPQQLLLVVMAGSGVVAAIHGAYLDGTPSPWPHIIADQAGWMGYVAAHAWAIYRRCQEPGL